MENPSDKFIDILRAVGEKPGFYLCPDRQGNCKSLSHLWTFIVGMQAGQTVEFDHVALDGFNEWVCLKYQTPASGMGWPGRILERAGHDETAAFQLFFEEFEEFLKERESIGTEAIKLRYQSWENRWLGGASDEETKLNFQAVPHVDFKRSKTSKLANRIHEPSTRKSESNHSNE